MKVKNEYLIGVSFSYYEGEFEGEDELRSLIVEYEIFAGTLVELNNFLLKTFAVKKGLSPKHFRIQGNQYLLSIELIPFDVINLFEDKIQSVGVFEDITLDISRMFLFVERLNPNRKEITLATPTGTECQHKVSGERIFVHRVYPRETGRKQPDLIVEYFGISEEGEEDIKPVFAKYYEIVETLK